MMNKRSVCLLPLLLLLLFVTGCTREQMPVEQPQDIVVDYDSLMNSWKSQGMADEIICWYTNEADQALLENAAKEFEEQYKVKVQCVCYDGVNLFEDINTENQSGNGPDVYLVGNDELELAVLSGLATANDNFNADFWKDNYPEVAKDAITYHEKQYGYPVYFDTYCLVYDADLLENAPASIDDILAFADEYEDTGSTKAIFRWDVADPYINSMFIASYADIFGAMGDDANSFSVKNEKTVASMEYFQSLSDYLWMDKTNISHDTVMNRIKEGTLVLGLCKSDILPVLYETEANYQVSYVPSLTQELSSTCYSTTYEMQINPYGKHQNIANMFALYLSYHNAEKQFEGNGKLPVVEKDTQFDAFQEVVYAQYLNSKPVPKVVILGDYLAESGIAFDAIWSGENVEEQLDWLQEKMNEKIK